MFLCSLPHLARRTWNPKRRSAGILFDSPSPKVASTQLRGPIALCAVSWLPKGKRQMCCPVLTPVRSRRRHWRCWGETYPSADATLTGLGRELNDVPKVCQAFDQAVFLLLFAT